MVIHRSGGRPPCSFLRLLLLQGMPHKFYHGKTGRVWNVTKRAIGVELLKQVGLRGHAGRVGAGGCACGVDRVCAAVRAMHARAANAADAG